jgi:predicted alpha/beta-fold hydrolase
MTSVAAAHPGWRPALPPDFEPRWWLANPHLQTLAGKFMRPEPELPYIRERWDTPDGDFLDLDFLPDRGRPLVLVLHGLEGHTRRRYILNLLRILSDAGMDGVALNFRHCSGEPNRHPRTYHSGETSDLGFVLGRLRERFPGRPLGVVGFSLGGNVALKYLGERGDGTPPPGAPGPLPEAAVAISVPYDLAAGADLLARSAMGRVYNQYFLRSLLSKVREKAGLLAGTVDLERLYRVRTLRAFDDLLTAPVNGFESASHYYEESSSQRWLAGIRTPTLLLHAQDDPFLPPARIPRGAMEENPALHPVITRRGGHVGFVRRRGAKAGWWMEQATARFLAEALAAPGATP